MWRRTSKSVSCRQPWYGAIKVQSHERAKKFFFIEIVFLTKIQSTRGNLYEHIHFFF